MFNLKGVPEVSFLSTFVGFFVLLFFLFGISCYSVPKLCPILCDPMDCSSPGLPVPHHLSEFAQVHADWINDAVQSLHPLLPPSAFSLSQHQGLFHWVSCSGLLVIAFCSSFWAGGLSFGVISFCLFIQLIGFSRQEYCSGLPLPPLVDHVLSEISTMTVCLGWPCMAWLIASSRFTTTRQWSMIWRQERYSSNVKISKIWFIFMYDKSFCISHFMKVLSYILNCSHQ